MLAPLQITARDVPLTTADELAIRRAADALESYGDRITTCRVAVALPHRHHRKGIPYEVRVDVGLPRGATLVSRQADPVLATAVQDAFSSVRRQVREHLERLAG